MSASYSPQRRSWSRRVCVECGTRGPLVVELGDGLAETYWPTARLVGERRWMHAVCAVPVRSSVV